jgi:carbamoyltransferase
MAVLGIGDSYDAGAALVEGCAALSAVSEERFTKNKNDVGFPLNCIRHICDSYDGEVQAVALAWVGGNAMVSRIAPWWGRQRRKLWRRELPRPSRARLRVTNLAYGLVQDQRPRPLWKALGAPISAGITRRRLRAIGNGLEGKKIYVVEHHLAHAACAYYASGYKEALVVTLDGAGDGLSGTVSVGDNGEIRRVAEFDASASIGILYGAATLACDMRYSEDEGKLMSLAAYSDPKRISELEGLCRYDKRSKRLVSNRKARNEFLLAEYLRDHVLAKHDRESFAYAIQAHVEEQITALIGQWADETGIRNVAVSGGVFSNVKANMLVEHMPEVKDFFVFPHMGDGGLPYGAAMYADFMLNGKLPCARIRDMYLGPAYSNDAISDGIKRHRELSCEEVEDPAGLAAELIAEKNRIVLWFQGRMEYGPRALGNRSVLALPSDVENRNRLNLLIKQRPYYQPFASTILEEDAHKLLDDYISPNRFMTGANHVRDSRFDDLVAASHIDHTTRPQMLDGENLEYRRLLERVRKRTGTGAVLNTSLNKHGRPMVLSPEDALWTLENTGADTLIMGNYLVEKRK